MRHDALKNKILASTPLAALIGDHQVSLTDRSGLKVGRCPFHEEQSASFTVYPDHYFCFGCRENGDAITFIRKIKGLGFIETLKYLGQRAGIDVSELDHQNPEERRDEARLYQALLAAQDFFRKNLASPVGNDARAYLVQRGFSSSAIDTLGFGLALNEPTALLDHLVGKLRFAPRELEACSLATPSAKNGRLYDFYRNRITIPIHDAHGRLVGFGGRARDDTPPKYKNSRENRLFDKSSLLFGLHVARDYVRKGEAAIVVEGYMDVLQLWQHGFTGAVACMGTALKLQHLRQIANLTNRVYLLFDGDQAGQKASLSAINAAMELPKLDVRLVTLPAGEDPDTFVNNNGPDALKSLLEKSEPLIDAVIRQKLTAASGVSISDVVAQELLPWLQTIADPFRRELLLNKISFYSGFNKTFLSEQMAPAANRLGATRVPKPVSSTAPQPASNQPLSGIEFELLGHLYFANPGELNLDDVESFIASEMELGPPWHQLAMDFIGSLRREQSPANEERARWLSSLDPEALALLDQFSLRTQAFKHQQRNSAIERLKREYSLKKRHVRVAALRSQLGQTSPDSAPSILAAIMALNKDIAALEKALKN